jgi:signal transduction histidine kinase
MREPDRRSPDPLTEVDLAKEAFLGVLSHELRTPINVIMGYTSLVADGMAGPTTGEQREYLGRVLEGAEALLALVNDMLDMSRIEAGRLTLARDAVDVGWALDQAIRAIGAAAEAKAIVITAEAAAGIPPASADEERLHQILRILLSNAVKFTPEGGAVTLRASAGEEGIRIEVRDTGVGIAPEDLPRMFRRFEQADGSATRAHGGAGLGLALAQRLVAAHGGLIGVESRPGVGSAFWFTLPPAPGA